MRLDETMLVKQLLPEICHFIHTHREGNQHAAELRISASGVLFSLSCNNFNAVFSRISTRWVVVYSNTNEGLLAHAYCSRSILNEHPPISRVILERAVTKPTCRLK